MKRITTVRYAHSYWDMDFLYKGWAIIKDTSSFADSLRLKCKI